MINSNLGSISHCFRDTAIYSLKLFIENCGQTAADGDICLLLTPYRVDQKWHHFCNLIISPNISRFSKFFHCRNQEKICDKTTVDPTTSQFCRYTTLWNIRWRAQAGDAADQLRDQHWSSMPCGPQTALSFAVLDVLQQMAYQRWWFTTVNQLKQAIVAEWGRLPQPQRLVNCAIGQWRRRLGCVVHQQGEHIKHFM